MTSFDFLLLRFLLASGGCLAAGLGVWCVTALLRRWLPDLAAQRSMWLLAQVTVAATFLVILLPHSERLRVIPQIELPVAGEADVAAPARATIPAGATGAVGAADKPAAERSWPALGARAWLVFYLLGLGYAGWRLVRARRVLNALAASGHRCYAGYAGYASDPLPGKTEMIEVNAPISPMLFGFFRARLLLPRHLHGFEPAQQQMIVEHELTHLRRHDLQWMSAGLLLQTLLWFNPFMRLLRANLSWAQELGCDRAVLAGRPPAQRKAYAAPLVAQLRLQHSTRNRTVDTALAFSSVSARLLASRIGLMRDADAGAATSHARGPWARLVAAGALAAVFLTSLAFQPALAWRLPPLARAFTPTALAPTAPPQSMSCMEMADAATGATLAHEGQCDERVTPASTFNIVVSLMGYDSGILRDDHTPRLPFKPGYVDYVPSWRQATDPTSWIRNSVLWYAQQVTVRLGAERLQQYVDRFDYGNRDVSGDAGKNNGLSMSWVGSSLKISPVEQVAFLRKMVNRQLPLTPHAYDMTSRIMKPVMLANGWQVQGKTGTAPPRARAGCASRTSGACARSPTTCRWRCTSSRWMPADSRASAS